MFQKLSLNKVEEREWLKEKVYLPKKRRSIELAKASVVALKQRNLKVTIQSIHETSKIVDPDGKGLHKNTILSNPEVYEVYNENRSYRHTIKTDSRSITFDANYKQYLKHIKGNRDLNSVRNRYRRLTKNELINRLIQCEQFVADIRDQWLLEQFKSE